MCEMRIPGEVISVGVLFLLDYRLPCYYTLKLWNY